MAYFPSYEIVTGQHTRGRYFAEDLRSVTEAGVTRVMALFFQHYTELGAGPAIEASPVGNIAPEQPYEQVLKSLAVMCDEEALERDPPPAPNTVGIAPARKHNSAAAPTGIAVNSIAKNPSMDNVRRMLEHPPATSAQDRFAIVWSDKKRDTLHRTARRELAAAVPIDVPLATALLRCAEGDFNQAENQVTEILRDNLHLCTRDNELFISLLYALFCVQRLDLAAAMLKDSTDSRGRFAFR